MTRRAGGDAIPAGWQLVPVGEPVLLNECPPGPFEFKGYLGYRSEYATTLENPRRYQVDAYCFDTGEYFWGGASGTEARGKLIVQPLTLAATPKAPAGSDADLTALRTAALHFVGDVQRLLLSKDENLLAFPLDSLERLLALLDPAAH